MNKWYECILIGRMKRERKLSKEIKILHLQNKVIQRLSQLSISRSFLKWVDYISVRSHVRSIVLRRFKLNSKNQSLKSFSLWKYHTLGERLKKNNKILKEKSIKNEVAKIFIKNSKHFLQKLVIKYYYNQKIKGKFKKWKCVISELIRMDRLHNRSIHKWQSNVMFKYFNYWLKYIKYSQNIRRSVLKTISNLCKSNVLKTTWKEWKTFVLYYKQLKRSRNILIV